MAYIYIRMIYIILEWTRLQTWRADSWLSWLWYCAVVLHDGKTGESPHGTSVLFFTIAYVYNDLKSESKQTKKMPQIPLSLLCYLPSSIPLPPFPEVTTIHYCPEFLAKHFHKSFNTCVTYVCISKLSSIVLHILNFKK